MKTFRGHNHMIVAFTSYIAFRAFLPGYSSINVGTLVFGLFWLIVASILPDIDHPNSMISGIALLPLFTIFSGHRKETHTIAALILSSLIFWIYDPWYGACFSLGYFTHLLADSLTVSGIPWFYGLTDKRYSFKLMKTGGVGEYAVVLVCLRYVLYRMG